MTHIYVFSATWDFRCRHLTAKVMYSIYQNLFTNFAFFICRLLLFTYNLRLNKVSTEQDCFNKALNVS